MSAQTCNEPNMRTHEKQTALHRLDFITAKLLSADDKGLQQQVLSSMRTEKKRLRLLASIY